MDVQKYYDVYARDVFRRKGYPLRAKYKANTLFEFSSEIIGERISSIADIGGCYGYCLAEFQKAYEREYCCKCHSVVYELGEDYINIGPTLFPNIRFLHSDRIGEEQFDIVLLCDVLEHIEDYDEFLLEINAMTDSTEETGSTKRFVLIWSPIEMYLLRKLAILLRLRPRMERGIDHQEGHVHFWGVRDTIRIVRKHFRILKVGYDSHRPTTERDGWGPRTGIGPAPMTIPRRLVEWPAKYLPESLYVMLMGGHLMILGETLENRDFKEVPR